MEPETRDVANTPRRIESLQNDRVKAIRSLEMRKVRRQTGQFVAEGVSVLMMARDAGQVPIMLVYCRERAETTACKALVDWALGSGAEVLEVTDAILAKLTTKDNPQAMLGVFRQDFADVPDAKAVPLEAVWIVLENVRDPGNLGTIIRTVDAVGAAGVVLLGTCCDPFSRESVRATMGSVFNVPILRLDQEEFGAWVRDWTGDVVGLHLDGTEDFRSTDYKRPVIAVMGSEGPGLSLEASALCSRLVKIPMAGDLDSLNLSVASALMLYQIRGPLLSL